MICCFFLFSCAYVVTPVPDSSSTSTSQTGWTGLVAGVSSTGTDLHIDVTIRNDTGDWSAMQATTGRPAVLTVDGKNTNCDTVFVGTGNNRLAPGFQMRGYIGGSKAEPVPQLLYVECSGATATPGSSLTIDYGFVTGPYNYYVAATPANAKLTLNLDQVNTDLQYPVAETIPDLIEKAGDKIVAINDCILTLNATQRTDTGLEFSWETNNPAEYPTYVHIGNPPVIGSDGILYGFYEDPTLADAPITLPGEKADWTTSVAVPQDVSNLYVLVSVESKQQKNFTSHVIDITDK